MRGMSAEQRRDTQKHRHAKSLGYVAGENSDTAFKIAMALIGGDKSAWDLVIAHPELAKNIESELRAEGETELIAQLHKKQHMAEVLVRSVVRAALRTY